MPGPVFGSQLCMLRVMPGPSHMGPDRKPADASGAWSREQLVWAAMTVWVLGSRAAPSLKEAEDLKSGSWGTRE